MVVTEPTTGTDTTKIKTTAVRKGDKYVINGQKVWISRIQHSDLMILLARTTPLAEVTKKSEGMSIFLVDLREAIGNGLRSEEHTSELQSLMRISYAVFCLKKKKNKKKINHN